MNERMQTHLSFGATYISSLILMGNTGSSRVPNKPSPRFLGYHSAPNFEICHVCNRNIERWDNLRQLTFWGLKFCKMHEVDGTPRCSGCNRFKVGRKTFIRNGNGEELGSPSPCCL
ncbi:unnamed protein product [Prunus armeniaca]|uniref:Uncharacterized protein n=1 Tax=Prunus armeniaca TaxID=36596 RepID=A0A6J5WCZ0_PRUAR|nr:unnamed protein product [Prunus armeniaca]